MSPSPQILRTMESRSTKLVIAHADPFAPRARRLPMAVLVIASAVASSGVCMPFMSSFAGQRPRTYVGFLAAAGLLGALIVPWLLVAVVLAAAVRFAMRRQFSKVAGLIIACAGAAFLNVVLAITFRRAHPPAATSFESVAQGVNFPSGHSMVALVAYGMLAYLC
jgi:membrane-associated phospholipid phosphatase